MFVCYFQREDWQKNKKKRQKHNPGSLKHRGIFFCFFIIFFNCIKCLERPAICIRINYIPEINYLQLVKIYIHVTNFISSQFNSPRKENNEGEIIIAVRSSAILQRVTFTLRLRDLYRIMFRFEALKVDIGVTPSSAVRNEIFKRILNLSEIVTYIRLRSYPSKRWIFSTVVSNSNDLSVSSVLAWQKFIIFFKALEFMGLV